jgi:membrane fusion protein (multidrug efflux system)
MYKKIILFIVPVIIIAACSRPATGLDAKKKELDSLQQKQSEINDKISKLRKEIDQLDTVAMKEKKVKSVEITKVVPQSFEHFIDGIAVVESDQNTMVMPKQPGFAINQIMVSPGDAVSAGQVLATVDNATMVQQLESLKTQYNLVKIAYERQKNLWEKQIGSEIQYLQAKTQKEAMEKNISMLQSQIANTNVVAPFDGMVDVVNYKVGDNSASPLGGIRVVNINRLKLTSRLADTYINKIKKGNKVVITIPDLGNKEIVSTISYVSNVINSQNRTFEIQVQLDNSNHDLKPNMQATLKVNDAVLPKAIVVNENLVMTSEGEKALFVATHEGDKLIARRIKIKTGDSYGGKVTVTEGLKEGDEVITTGYSNINDGEEVKL